MCADVGRKPRILSPSSVSVPVLSNTNVSIWPAMLIRGGEMQNILWFFRRIVAKTTPADIETGRAAGIAVVIKFRALWIMTFSGASNLI